MAMGSQDKEYSIIDVGASVFFKANQKQNEDLKIMLEMNKDSMKLEAMKRIIAMIAKGHNALELFPCVIKNIVTKNLELKKLICLYLLRYAEEKQDVALLSISTFQRMLKEPNQLFRGSALRVMSSIRISMIAPIIMMAIKDGVTDMSSYVRRIVAHALPKMYALDNNMKSQLTVILEKLLNDKALIVTGSAVMAFTRICPERVDLLHKVYRRLCAILGDVDEWRQVTIINGLTRYARSQFSDPLKIDGTVIEGVNINSDHYLLLRSVKPLLQSRNSAVVMAVAQMYHHIGSNSERIQGIKALMRLLRSYPEVQELVLKVMVTMSSNDSGAFEFYLKSFFVRSSDPLRVKLLKLAVLRNIITENNISVILKELTGYINGSDDRFVAASIQTIGHCASFDLVTDLCFSGLVGLLSNKKPIVVAESVVIIKRLLQSNDDRTAHIIRLMMKLLEKIQLPQARASIIWLIGEHSRDTPSAMNTLKRLVKNFTSEMDAVKLQVLNLCVKLYIGNEDKYALIAQYLFKLAMYDSSYDVRDRARLLRNFIGNHPSNILIESAAKIFLAAKPAPSCSLREESNLYQLGSLSHVINMRANGYEPLPEWPDVASSNSIRDIAVEVEVSAREAIDGSSTSSVESDWGTTDSDGDFDMSAPLKSDKKSDEDLTSVTMSEEIIEFDLEQEGASETHEATESNLDLLMDLSLHDGSGPILMPVHPGASSEIELVSPRAVDTKTFVVLDKMNGRGLSVTGRFTRYPHLFSAKMVNLNLLFTNNTEHEITHVGMGDKILPPGMSFHDFALIENLTPNSSIPGTLGIDFNDTLHDVKFEIVSSAGVARVCVKAPVGELLRPVKMSETEFLLQQRKLKGMNEHSVKIAESEVDLQMRVLEAANLGVCPNSDGDILRLCGQTLGSSSLILVTLIKVETEIEITVNCEKFVIASMLLQELKSKLVEK